jgi:hypothetical protein
MQKRAELLAAKLVVVFEKDLHFSDPKSNI